MSNLNYQAAIEISAQYTGQSAVAKANVDIKSLGGASKALKHELTDLAKEVLPELLALFSAEKIIEFGKYVIELGAQMEHLSEKTGIGVDALSDLKTAAELGGLNFEGFEKALKKFAGTSAEAAAGNQKAADGFKALGISVKDSSGQIKGTDALLFEVADKFEKLKDGPAKAAISMRLFGKSGVDMIPVLNEGSEALKGLGIKFGDEFTGNARKFESSMILIKNNTTQFGVNILNGALPALNDLAAAIIDIGKSSGPGNGFSILGETIRQLGVIGVTVFEALAASFELLATYVTEVIGYVKFLANEFVDLGTAAGAAFDFITGNTTKAAQGFKKYLSDAKSDLQQFTDFSKAAGEEAAKNALNRAKTTADIIAKLEKGSQIFGDGKSTAPDIKHPKTGTANIPEEGSLKKESDAIKKLQEDLKAVNEQYQLQADSIGLSTVALEKRKIEIEENKKADKEVATFQNTEMKNAYLGITKQIIAQKEAIIDLKQAQKESFGNGAVEAVKEYSDSIKDVASQSKKLFTDAFKGIEDSLVNFVKTGKLSFASLADAIETDLIRIAVRQAILAPLLGALGSALAPASAAAGAAGTAASSSSQFGGVGFSGTFADGGIMTSAGPMGLRKYANGGVANSPQLALFGEGRKPEAYVPLPDGRSIPVTMNGGSGGGGTSVIVNVSIDSNGDQSSSSQTASASGQQLGNLISAAVVSELVKQKRPGGILS